MTWKEMNEDAKPDLDPVPMLFPYEPEMFWQRMQRLIHDELTQLRIPNEQKETTWKTPGLTYKPLYKMEEICLMFHITRPTVYDWIKHGKLKRYKIRSRVYFLWNDIQQLLSASIQ